MYIPYVYFSVLLSCFLFILLTVYLYLVSLCGTGVFNKAPVDKQSEITNDIMSKYTWGECACLLYLLTCLLNRMIRRVTYYKGFVLRRVTKWRESK